MAKCSNCSAVIPDDARVCPECGSVQTKSQNNTPEQDPLLGHIIATKFKIEKLLGVGGMGKVYKARQLTLDKIVVIKVLHDQFREDSQLVQRFQREARAASRLNHPNSIQIIDFGQDESGIVFMAMEFLQGSDLFTVLRKEGPLKVDRICRIMIQACSALAEAHEQNVIHRDLKPENIMIEDRRGKRDFVKVLDFGIAKIQDTAGPDGQALTATGMVCGTPEYMSPEQGRGLVLDPRSDIYSLGVIMFQLSTGELPFTADSPIGIVTKHILEEPPSLRKKYPHLNIPIAFESIVLRAMAKDAEERFPSVIELGESLEAVLKALQGNTSTQTTTFERGNNLSGNQFSSSNNRQTSDNQQYNTQNNQSNHNNYNTQNNQNNQNNQSQYNQNQYNQNQNTTQHNQQYNTQNNQYNNQYNNNQSGQSFPPNNQMGMNQTGQMGQNYQNNQNNNQNSNNKWIAIAAVAVLALGGTTAFALKDKLFGSPETKADAGVVTPTPTPPPTPNNTPSNTPSNTPTPAPTPTPSVDPVPAPTPINAPTASPTPANGPSATPSNTPSGTPKATPSNTPTSSPTPAPTPTPKVTPEPAPSAGNNAELARQLYAEGQELLASGQNDSAYSKFKEALRADPSYAEPIQAIAVYHKKTGNADKACSAIKDFIRRKNMNEDRAKKLEGLYCAP